MVNNLDYAQTVARIRVLENKLVNENQIERLVDSQKVNSFFDVLSDTAYADHFDITNNPHEFQKILDIEFEKTANFLKKNTPFPEELDWLWIKYDVLNIKYALKKKLTNEEITKDDLNSLGNIDRLKIIEALDEPDKSELDEVYIDLIKKAKSIFEKNKDPKEIDQVIDKAYFEILETKTKKIKSKILREFIKSKIDLYNLKLIFRLKNQEQDEKTFKKYVVSGGSIKKENIIEAYKHDLSSLKSNFSFIKYDKVISLSLDYLKKYNSFLLFEKMSYDYLIDQIRYAKYEPFGPEPLVGYFIAKDNEIKLIRMIMIYKINNIEPTLIHQQLRKLYLER